MESDAEFMERQARLLKGLSEQAARLAEDFQTCALAAETSEEKQALAFSFHRMGRALRQTLALEAKLRRDVARDLREARAEAEAAETARRAARKARVQATLERLIWQEAEDYDWASERLEDARRFVAEDEAHDRLPDADEVEAYILRLCRELELEPPTDGDAAEDPGAAPGAGAGGSGPPADDEERDYWSSP